PGRLSTDLAGAGVDSVPLPGQREHQRLKADSNKVNQALALSCCLRMNSRAEPETVRSGRPLSTFGSPPRACFFSDHALKARHREVASRGDAAAVRARWDQWYRYERR